MQDNKLAVQATGSSPVWASLIERANVAAGFNLAVQPDPYQPTDVATFNQAAVPSLNFTTGAHLDYHKPSDTADKINYEDLDRIAEMATAIARELMEPDAGAAVRQGRAVVADRQSHRRSGVHRHRAGLRRRSEGTAAGRRDRWRASRAGRPAEGRRHRRDRRPDDRQHLRLHLRAGAVEDRSAGEGRLHARRASGARRR